MTLNRMITCHVSFILGQYELKLMPSKDWYAKKSLGYLGNLKGNSVSYTTCYVNYLNRFYFFFMHTFLKWWNNSSTQSQRIQSISKEKLYKNILTSSWQFLYWLHVFLVFIHFQIHPIPISVQFQFNNNFDSMTCPKKREHTQYDTSSWRMR